MLVRIFPEGFAFVQNQEIEVQNIGNGLFLLPLLRDQIDVNTLQANSDIFLSDRNAATVYKDGNTFTGLLIEHDSNSVTLSDRGMRTIIREYDRIHIPEFIVVQSVNNMMLDEVTISYVTTGIRGNIIHHLNIDSGLLQTELHIENETAMDINDAIIEIVTSEQTQPLLQRQVFASGVNDATIGSTPAGSIIRLDERYNIPSGYEAFLSLFTQEIDGDIIYMINAPNGRTNATYTLQWSSHVDIPPGTLLVYHNDILEARTSLGLVGAGQQQTITLLNIPSVYARGTITRTTAVQEASKEIHQRTSTVRLQGTIFNTLPDEITVHLRYRVDDANVDVLSNDEAIIDEGYLIFHHTLAGNSKEQYDHSFTLTF